MTTTPVEFFDYSAHFDAITLDADRDRHGNPGERVTVLGFEQGRDGRPVAFLNPAQFDAYAAAVMRLDGIPADQEVDGMEYLGLTVEPYRTPTGEAVYAAVLPSLDSRSTAAWTPVRFW